MFYGLTVAHDVVHDNSVPGSVRYLAARMLDYLQHHGWFVIMPDGSVTTTFRGSGDQQLSFLKLGRRMDSHYRGSYVAMSLVLAPETIAPIALDVADPCSSYFKFNLDTISFYGLLDSGDNSFVRLSYQKAYDILRNTTADHRYAFFHMIDRSIAGPNPNRDAETVQLLQDWLKRPHRDHSWTCVVLFQRAATETGPAPRFPWSSACPRISDFESAWKRRVDIEIDSESGFRVPVISCDDLIAARLAAARPQDIIDVAALRQTAQEQMNAPYEISRDKPPG